MLRPSNPSRPSNSDGFHFHNGNPDAQMEALHYCSILNEDFIKCVIFDGNTKGSKIMGVKYIIGETLFCRVASQGAGDVAQPRL